MTITATPEGATCTVTVTATGGTCGAPAICSFKARDGRIFHECAAHDTSSVIDASSLPEEGSPVRVTHIGVAKIGRVAWIVGSRAHVEVPVGRGRTATTKIIVIPVDALQIVR